MKKRINRWVLIGSLGVFGVLCLTGGGTLAADKAGKPAMDSPAQPAVPQQKAVIQLDEPTFNFGEALEGAEVVHDFVVKNTGNAVLQIDQVRPG